MSMQLFTSEVLRSLVLSSANNSENSAKIENSREDSAGMRKVSVQFVAFPNGGDQ